MTEFITGYQTANNFSQSEGRDSLFGRCGDLYRFYFQFQSTVSVRAREGYERRGGKTVDPVMIISQETRTKMLYEKTLAGEMYHTTELLS